MKYSVAILYHNYYSLEGVDEIRAKIGALHRDDILLLCSLPEKFAGRIPCQKANEKFAIAPNSGKDIGGKLLLMQLLLTLYPETPYAVLLHDKRSYHKHSGRWEKEGLFRIAAPDLFPVVEAAFGRDPKMGIACSKGYIRNEYLGNGKFNTPNSTLLNGMLTRYGLPDHDLRFVAGTMFWIRTSILRSFFAAESPLEVRATLERGNALDHEKGTVTHCWERMFSWMATASGYKIREF
ncbi:MAG TPA: rhamnan synthesis F family protein [Puia sp.]|nr:rhamnan synthesis F family protein [Puia sp.]